MISSGYQNNGRVLPGMVVQMNDDYCWSIKRDSSNIEHERQSKRKFLPQFLCSRRFYFCCLNDLMKILVGLGIFNYVIFKDLGSDCYCRNSIFQ